MRKTKKQLLSLVLTVAMMFMLFAGVTVFADEDPTTLPAPAPDTSNVGNFTDVQWSSQYAEAIAVLAAAKITTGTTDSTFGPKENVTREQVAAFIARSKLGTAKAEQLLPAETGFSDVAKDDFFSKYIAFCVSENAINGLGDGTYDPKGNVTGVQVLKILEGVLNVDKVTELTGPLWETNTISYAIKLGLLDGVTVEDYGAPATREQIAQYILNALITYGYYDSGYGTSSTGWQTGATPLYVTNGLSRRQTEDTSKTDDGTFDADKFMTTVTPYGELYYRWETAANGRGITSWKHDDKNEKLVETVIANPSTTGALASSNPDVFKFYINGAVVNAVAAGNTANSVNGIDDVNRYRTNEYTFDPGLARSAFVAVAGTPDAYSRVTDETWTGATIKIYEQRLSNDGVYDPVTGRYNSTGFSYATRAFDGKADKVVVTYEYLGEVAYKSTTNGLTTYEIDISDAAIGSPTSGRSGNGTVSVATTYAGAWAVDDMVRIIPKLPQTGAISGAYQGWFTATTTGGVTTWAPIAGTGPNYRWNYVSPYGITLLRVEKADTASITPSSYGYSYSATGSTQTTERRGLYISATQSGTLTWIDGTYQEILRKENSDLYADGSRYTVYLDENGYILGGFTQSGADYAFLTYPLSNENAKTSTWQWISTNNSDPRSVTYYPGPNIQGLNSAFKAYNASAPNTALGTQTHSTRDIDNGVLNAGTTVSGDAAFVYIGDVVRVWNNHAKILPAQLTNFDGGSLPSDGKLYIERTVSYGYVTFSQRSASEAKTSLSRRSGARVWLYEDENYIPNDKYKVYVIDYAPTDPATVPLTFVPPHIKATGTPGVTNLLTLTSPAQTTETWTQGTQGTVTFTLNAPLVGPGAIDVSVTPGGVGAPVTSTILYGPDFAPGTGIATSYNGTPTTATQQAELVAQLLWGGSGAFASADWNAPTVTPNLVTGAVTLTFTRKAYDLGSPSATDSQDWVTYKQNNNLPQDAHIHGGWPGDIYALTVTGGTGPAPTINAVTTPGVSYTRTPGHGAIYTLTLPVAGLAAGKKITLTYTGTTPQTGSAEFEVTLTGAGLNGTALATELAARISALSGGGSAITYTAGSPALLVTTWASGGVTANANTVVIELASTATGTLTATLT